MAVMMQCGHAANATMEDGKPVCAICYGINAGADEVNTRPPALIGREAQCTYCKKITASTTDLAFFRYRGYGSQDAADVCKDCPYRITAHGDPNAFGAKGITDHVFAPHGPFEYDQYYCGCRGWD